ncbi:MAG TPA: RNase adapter RapZ [Oscillospiraceae bacterium]|nr:RNase adapter RapZ [Oscillospiraceae bacterium]
MQFVIVTGLSGSGKSGAINVLEDIGFYCIDNMPPQLINKFAEICTQSDGKIERVAIVTDIRGGELFFKLAESIETLKEQGLDVKILFLDAGDDVIVKRYKETRRKHPLDESVHGSIHRAILAEREILRSVREVADYYIDTSFLSVSQLKEQINSIFLENINDFMIVKVMSFGFKYGAPNEADLVFDVRCLPNPFYIKELKEHTGKESCVNDYVMQFEQSQTLLNKLKDLIDFLIPLYVHEGKSQLVIAFGCTGGKHRSVTFAEQLFSYLKDKNVKARISHRDITKDR